MFGNCISQNWLFCLFRYDALLHEKEELEEAFESFRQEIMLTRDGTAAKETRLLKKVIRNLEVHASLFV